jgi:hypothetical protein
MAEDVGLSLFLIEPFYLGEWLAMLKKRIVVSAITLALSIPCLAQAAPLSWTPGPDVLAQLSRWWDLLPGWQPAPAARSARDARKNGCGMDPNGVPLCGPGPGSGGLAAPSPAPVVKGK